MPQGSTVITEWHGDAITADMRRGAVRGLKKACDYARSEVTRVISVSARVGQGGTVNPTKDGGPPVLLDHSKAGEPPRSNFGGLRKTIFSRVDEEGLFGVIGTTSMIGIFMEKGTAVPLAAA